MNILKNIMVTAGFVAGISASNAYAQVTYESLVGATPAETAANIETLIAGASGTLTIPAGDYELADHDTTNPQILSITGKNHLTINAVGARFIFKENKRGLYISDAVDLTLKGLELDYDPLPFTQGTITSVGSKYLVDGVGYQDVDIVVHDGYDLIESTKSRAIAYNQNNQFIVRGSATRGCSTVTHPTGTSARTLRVTSKYRPDSIKVGNYLSLTKTFDSPHTIVMWEMKNSKLQDVKIRAANVISIFDYRGSNNRYLNVEISPGAMPSGASVPRLMSGNSGGIIVKHAKIGPQIRNSTIKSNGDDGINIHGEYHPVFQASGGDVRIVTRSTNGPEFDDGDEVYVLDRDNGTIVGPATVTLVGADTTEDYATFMLDKFPKRFSLGCDGSRNNQFTTGWDITLSPQLVTKPGDVLFSPDNAGRDYKITNNFIQNSRARGILAKGPYGFISGNTIDHMGIGGIVVASEQENWLETSYTQGSSSCDAGGPETPEGVRIIGNTVKRTGFQFSNKKMESVGGITITGPYELPYNFANPDRAVHKDIEIRNNTLDRVTGANLVVMYAHCVSIKNNIFKKSHIDATLNGTLVGIDPKKIAVIDRADDVHFSGNKVYEHAAQNELVSTPFIYLLGSDTADVTGLPSGLVLVPEP